VGLLWSRRPEWIWNAALQRRNPRAPRSHHSRRTASHQWPARHRGSTFFLQFAPEALAHWLSRPDLLARARQLQHGGTAWINQKRARGEVVSENHFRERGRPDYILAHSLAHALMSEVALDCGYPASALKERLYVLPRDPGQPIQWYFDLHRRCRQSGNVGWSRRSDAALCVASYVRARKRTPLLRRSSLRRP
jgi:hypothetical protein